MKYKIKTIASFSEIKIKIDKHLVRQHNKEKQKTQISNTRMRDVPLVQIL